MKPMNYSIRSKCGLESYRFIVSIEHQISVRIINLNIGLCIFSEVESVVEWHIQCCGFASGESFDMRCYIYNLWTINSDVLSRYSKVVNRKVSFEIVNWK